MSKSPTTGRRLYASLPAAGAGIIFTGVGLVFNSTYGYSMGGDDVARKFGMAAVMIGCIFLKDYLPGQAFVAFKSKRIGLGFVCCLGALLGATFSFIAAFGSASDGQAEKSNPLQAQIDAYNTAIKTDGELTRRLNKLADTQPPQGDETALAASLTKALKGADATVKSRTADCTKMTGFGPKATEWNAENCDAVVSARSALEAFKSAQQRADDKDKEAETIRVKLEEVRKVIAKGAPKSADNLNANLSDLWKKLTGSKGDISFSSIFALLCAGIIEIGAPVSWSIFALTNASSTIPRKVPMEFQNYVPQPTNRRGRPRDQKIVDFTTRFRKVHGRNPRIPEMQSQFPQTPKTTLWRYSKVC